MSTRRSALSRALGGLLTYAALLPSRSPRRWVFGSWFGRQFSDNSKHLFLHVERERPDLHATWITRDRKVLRELRARGHRAAHAWSPRGMWATLRAGVVVVSQSLDDVNPYLVGRARVAQLWHGTPLKRIGFDSERVAQREASLRALATYKRVFPGSRFGDYDVVTANSEFTRDRFASAFGLPVERVPVVGFARHDALHRKVETPFLARLRERVAFKRLLLYAPTFRDTGGDLLALGRFHPRLVEERLREMDAVLVVKAHALDAAGWAPRLGSSGRVVVAQPGEADDIYEIMPHADVLLADYSSVVFDFLLLDRPIVFVPFDLEKYLEKDREMYVPYDEVVCGPLARDWASALDAAQAQLKEDSFAARRREVRSRFDAFVDDQNCRRIVAAIERAP